jgi:hypothetical protein
MKNISTELSSIVPDIQQYTIASEVVYAGGYQIGGPDALQINFKSKPNWLHRFFCKLILGFVWVDIPL